MLTLIFLGQTSSTTTVGGTTQLGGILSSGGVVTGNTVGGAAQLSLFTSTGGVKTNVEEATGGFWFAYNQELYNRERRKKKKEEKIESIPDEIDKEIAKEFYKKNSNDERLKDLRKLTAIAAQYEDVIQDIANARLQKALIEAKNKKTFSTMERLERELRNYKEEEEFLMLATQIILQ